MSLFACAHLVQIVTSIEVSPPQHPRQLGVHLSAEGEDTHPAQLTAKSMLFDEEYTGLYSFSVAHT